MRILLTGGAGCLGSNIVERYWSEGHDILVVDNFATGKREVVPPRERLQLIEGSIADAALVAQACDSFRPTHVIHSAAAYKDPNDWAEDVRTNVIGAINVAKSAAEFGVARLVNFQTALCYGRPASVPIEIGSATAPFTSYGISKTAGEAYLLNSGLPVASLRLANICGPRLAIGPIPTFYKRLNAEQSCFCSDTTRDFLDMADFLDLLDLALDRNAPTGAFNVSTGRGHTIKEVFDVVAEHVFGETRDVPILPAGEDDVASVVLDGSVTERTFGWRPRFDFRETIRRQLAWYDKYGVNDIYSHLADPTAEAVRGAS